MTRGVRHLACPALRGAFASPTLAAMASAGNFDEVSAKLDDVETTEQSPEVSLPYFALPSVGPILRPPSRLLQDRRMLAGLLNDMERFVQTQMDLRSWILGGGLDAAVRAAARSPD